VQLFADHNVVIYVFMLAAFFTSVLLMLRGNRYFSRQARQVSAIGEPEPLASRPAFPQPAHAQAERERWEVEMHELARSFSAQVDTKMGRLEQLIRHADRAAARLEAALAVAQGTGRQTPQGGASAISRTAAPDIDAAGGADFAAGANAGGQPRPASQAAKLLAAEQAVLPCLTAKIAATGLTADAPPRGAPPAQAAGTSPAPGQVDGSSLPRAERYDEIYLLSDYGYSTAEIARRAAVPQGEVELILRLRSRR